MNENKFIPTRRSLLSRLKSWDNEDSWREFFNTYWRLIYDFAVKAGLNDAQAQDVVQDTIISVAGEMKDFRYDAARGSFKRWLLQVTRCRVADHLRKQYRTGEVGAPRADDPAVAAWLSEVPDGTSRQLEMLWDEEWRRHIATAAMARVRRKVRPEQFQMFELSVVNGWPVAKVASALGASLTQVYMARHRVSRQVEKEIQHLERNLV